MRVKIMAVFTLAIALLLSAQRLSAQIFTEVVPNPPFDGVMNSSVAFADFNGDGYQDVLISGENTSAERIAKLYVNDGLGVFTEIANTPFDGVSDSSIAVSDFNGDGYSDILITGSKEVFGDGGIAKLYINDGLANFTEMANTPFDGVSHSSTIVSDVNGDGYDDVFITGRTPWTQRIAKLYINDGLANFTEMANTPFDGAWYGSAAFADVNGDGHEDVLITGENSSWERIAKLYTNDGLGNFTEVTNTAFEGVMYGAAAFADVNGDGHEDVLITGENSVSEQIAKLYINNGLGEFTEISNAPFDGVSDSSIAFADVNGDGNDDVLIVGANTQLERIAKLYTNDGLGNFTEINNTPFDGVRYGAIAFTDVNSDGYEDVLITGQNNSMERIAKLYVGNRGLSSVGELEGRIDLDFILYPNPSTSSTLYLQYKATEIGAQTRVKVFNMNGVLLQQYSKVEALGQQSFPIDLSSFSKGYYLLELQCGNRKGTAKFFIP